MRVDVFPEHATPAPGQPVVLTVQVFNSAPVISAHRVRVLGVDEKWVSVDHDQLSLFPESTGIVIVTVTLPRGIPAGTRRIAIQVHELTPPGRTETVNVDLTIPAEQGARIMVDPVSVTGGSKATVGVTLANDGNTDLLLRLDAVDEEDKLQFAFDPPVVELAPGERMTASIRIKGRRPFLGSPKPRTYTVRALGTEPPLEGFGSFVQNPRLSRGAVGMIGLLAAVSVFAVVIAMTFAKVVDKSVADRDLLLQVIQGRRGDSVTNPGSLSGKVSLLTTGAGAGGVTVEAFDADNAGSPVTTTATADDGSYSVTGLSAGTYKLRYQGAGFSEIWFPQALTADNAKAIELAAGQDVSGLDVRLGGVPGKIGGKVTGDASGATVSLYLPGATSAGGGGSGGTTGAALVNGRRQEAPPDSTTTTAPPAAPSDSTGATQDATALGALVSSTPIGGDGKFLLTDVPSPSTYDLVVQKEGFATEVQRVNLGAGEERNGIEILLRKGDGLIQGKVFDADGPLGGATVTASDGSSTSATVSLTQDDVGAFTLRNLPTPSTLTLLVSKTGFTTQSLTLSLASGQQLTGVVVTLTGGAGSISGTATLASTGKPAGGVSVVVSNGSITLQTVTLSVDPVGSYQVTGLPVPGTYTVTFSRADLASVTQAVDLDEFGQKDLKDVGANLPDATGAVTGTVTELGTDLGGVGEVDVSLSDGTTTFRTKTATDPDPGAYLLSNVKPATYTLTFERRGAAPVSFIVTVAAGELVQQDAQVGQPAAVIGRVVFAPGNPNEGQPLADVEVRIFVLSQYPNTVLTKVITDAEGHFSFTDLIAPESYLLEFAFPPGAPAQVTRTLFTVEAGEIRDVGDVPVSTG
jgi:5-hydroxyisourate hydrolase-like protein (transthyretin family)